ncbi:MAG TPA: zinc ABC transporter substrate-binding protein [Thermoplasmata archaeon]|nr:zinc ABC transporter substrate-binding protein [Thermoplasmata archaeon]
MDLQRHAQWTIIAIIAVSVSLVVAGVAYYALTRAGPTGPQVVASFYPYRYFTSRVAGDRYSVVALVPPGVEPHDWEPTPGDAARMASSVAFVYNGYIEVYLQGFFADLPPDQPVRINASAGLGVLHGGEGGASAIDPHLWLDPVYVETTAMNIADGLTKADPAGNATYHANAARLVQDLVALNATFESGLTHCGRREFITQHEAFAYLAKRYNLTQYAIQGLSPDQEPTPAQIQQILNVINQTGSKYIFYEELVSPAVAQALAQEAHVQTMVLSPIEGLNATESQNGDTYLTLMEMNLANLRTALECT